MVDQIDPEQFEVVVVDGGSSDGSKDILRDLAAEYPNLRAVLDRSDEADELGGDRNISFEEARGEYVLESLDTDDRYYHGVIDDFVRIYHLLESEIEKQFFLSGTGINMAPRELLTEVPYYDLGGAEDRDLWRRLFAREALVWLQHEDISEQIGYHMNVEDQIRRDIHGKICDFQSGISLLSALLWSISHERRFILERDRGKILNNLKKPYDLMTHIYAYLKAHRRDHHSAPPGFRSKGALEQHIAKTRGTLPELADKHGVDIDRTAFSENGHEAFFPE
jgi:glycosyltransferase involved in cell wall biosynthesis